MGTSLDFDLRVHIDGYKNVITHEFTHIIQIGSSMKASTRFPAIYFQGFSMKMKKEMTYCMVIQIQCFQFQFLVLPYLHG